MDIPRAKNNIPETDKEQIEHLTAALKCCLKSIALLQETNPTYMTIFLRLSYKHGLATLKRHLISTDDLLDMPIPKE